MKIDKGIEVPSGRKQTKYPFADLGVGDSFAAGEYATTLAISVRNSANRYKILYAPEAEYIIRKHEDNVRCWRTK